MKAIIVTGTPGTGKTTIARALAEKYNLEYVDVNQVIDEQGLKEGYDNERDCDIVDADRLNKVLIAMIGSSKDRLVIDSHLSHNLPSKHVELCIVTKCGLKELKKRLGKRGYSKKKIRENLDAEIFDICQIEAVDKHRIVEIWTDKKIDFESLERFI